MRRTVTAVLTATFAVSLLAGCGSDDKETSSPTTTATATNELKATVSANGDQLKLDIPTSVAGGVVELSFTNSAPGAHSLQIVKVAGDHTMAEVLDFIKNSEDGGPVPDWISEGGGIGDVGPGQTGTSTFKLTAGKHFAWDDETDDNNVNNGTKGAIAELNVTGNGSGELPAADAVITAKEYEFTVKGLKAGTNPIRFENDGKQFHHFIAAPLVPGKTLDEVKAFFEAQGQGSTPPPIDFEKGVGGAVVDAGNAVVYESIELQAGDYAMVCFVNDRAGGPPHFTLGMLQKVTVA